MSIESKQGEHARKLGEYYHPATETEAPALTGLSFDGLVSVKERTRIDHNGVKNAIVVLTDQTAWVSPIYGGEAKKSDPTEFSVWSEVGKLKVYSKKEDMTFEQWQLPLFVAAVTGGDMAEAMAVVVSAKAKIDADSADATARYERWQAICKIQKPILQKKIAEEIGLTTIFINKDGCVSRKCFEGSRHIKSVADLIEIDEKNWGTFSSDKGLLADLERCANPPALEELLEGA